MRMNRKKKVAGKRQKRAKEGECLLDGYGLGARKKRTVERAYAAETGEERKSAEMELQARRKSLGAGLVTHQGFLFLTWKRAQLFSDFW